VSFVIQSDEFAKEFRLSVKRAQADRVISWASVTTPRVLQDRQSNGEDMARKRSGKKKRSKGRPAPSRSVSFSARRVAERIAAAGVEYLEANFARIMQESADLRQEREFADLYLEPMPLLGPQHGIFRVSVGGQSGRSAGVRRRRPRSTTIIASRCSTTWTHPNCGSSYRVG